MDSRTRIGTLVVFLDFHVERSIEMYSKSGIRFVESQNRLTQGGARLRRAIPTCDVIGGIRPASRDVARETLAPPFGTPESSWLSKLVSLCPRPGTRFSRKCDLTGGFCGFKGGFWPNGTWHGTGLSSMEQ